MTIRILIVDDHQVVRRGLCLFLNSRPEFTLVGEASSGEEALELCASLSPDVVMMDVMMPGMDGIETTKRIHQRFPQIRVIALTTFSSRNQVRAMMRAGAISYLVKDADLDEMAEAITAAMRGQTTLSAAAVHALLQTAPLAEVSTAATPPATPSTADTLSTREMDVLRLIGDGKTNNAIADDLYISTATVRFHVSNILEKLQVSNRLEAVRSALDKKLIT
jgi:two-component system, NarL family, response regulator LiaR